MFLSVVDTSRERIHIQPNGQKYRLAVDILVSKRVYTDSGDGNDKLWFLGRFAIFTSIEGGGSTPLFFAVFGPSRTVEV